MGNEHATWQVGARPPLCAGCRSPLGRPVIGHSTYGPDTRGIVSASGGQYHYHCYALARALGSIARQDASSPSVASATDWP